jgi:hypothetical protein
MTSRKVSISVLLDTSTLDKLEATSKSNEESLSATARNLIEKGIVVNK